MKTFTEHLLLENRVDFLKAKYLHDIMVEGSRQGMWTPDDVFDTRYCDDTWQEVRNTDPTPNHMYLDWICRQFINQGTRLEDSQKLLDDLTLFHQVKSRLPVEYRDINKLKTDSQLYTILAPFREVVSKSNRQIDREQVEALKGQIRVIYDGPDGKIMVPKTWEASKYLGRGTRWCTSMKDDPQWFHTYHSQAPLYVFIFPNGDKRQLWTRNYFSTEWKRWGEMFEYNGFQYMNEDDEASNVGLLFKSALYKHFVTSKLTAEEALVCARYELNYAHGKTAFKNLMDNDRSWLKTTWLKSVDKYVKEFQYHTNPRELEQIMNEMPSSTDVRFLLSVMQHSGVEVPRWAR